MERYAIAIRPGLHTQQVLSQQTKQKSMHSQAHNACLRLQQLDDDGDLTPSEYENKWRAMHDEYTHGSTVEAGLPY